MMDGEAKRAMELVFLPGFDGAADLRRTFTEELARAAPVRSVSYPRYPLGSLDEYQRFAAAEARSDAALVLVAESFSGLVAVRWAAREPRVVALVLCGCFARNPVGFAANLGAMLPGVTKLGPRVCSVFLSQPANAMHRDWSQGLVRTLREMRDEVVAERLRLIAAEDVRAELSALRIPLVLLQYDGDLVLSRKARGELEAVCHNAEVVRIAGPHFAIETQPRECAEAIVARLRTLFPMLSTSP